MMTHTKHIRGSLTLGIIAVSALFACGLFFANPADALTVSPPTAEFLLEPGVQHASKIKLYNETDRTLSLYTEVVNFGAEGESGAPSYDFDSEKIGLSSWISVAGDVITLESGQSKEVPVFIDTPATASPGGHYAAVFFSEDPSTPEEGGEVTIGSKIGTLYLARVAGDVIESGQIASFTTSRSSYSRLPVEFAIRFQNTGNTHLRPTGQIQVKNMFGQTSATVDVNPTKGATLPSQIRKYEASWEKNMVDEELGNVWSDFWREFGNERKNFAFGRYTATVALTSGSGTSLTHSATTVFWVLPWRIIIITIIGLLVLALLLIVLIKKYNNWIVSKASEHVRNQPQETTKGKKGKQ